MRRQAALENNRRSSREAKRRRRGTCEDCGTETRYNGHRDGVSRRCPACAAIRNGAALRGTGPRQRQLYALLASGVTRFSELRDALGVSSQHTMALLKREMRYGRICRVARGRYELAEGGWAT